MANYKKPSAPRRQYSNIKVFADNSGVTESKDGYWTFEGKVIKVEPGSRFKVQINVTIGGQDKEFIIDAYTSGHLRMNKIRIVQGDIVIVAVPVSDLSKGRITHRKDYKAPVDTNATT